MKRKLSGAETPTFQKPVPMPPIKPAKETSVITNYDRIVSKSPEELAKWLSYLAPCCHCEAVPEEKNQVIHPHNCYEKWFDWLKQEAYNNGTD